MAEILLLKDVFTQHILPFLLVFTLLFAILEKTKILGEDVKQVNAIVSAVAALLFVSFLYPIQFVTNMILFLTVAIIVILVFMLLYGFVSATNKEGFSMNKGLKITFGIIIGIAMIIAILWASGVWGTLYETLFKQDWSTSFWVNFLFIVAIAGAIAVVLSSKESSSG